MRGRTLWWALAVAGCAPGPTSSHAVSDAWYGSAAPSSEVFADGATAALDGDLSAAGPAAAGRDAPAQGAADGDLGPDLPSAGSRDTTGGADDLPDKACTDEACTDEACTGEAPDASETDLAGDLSQDVGAAPDGGPGPSEGGPDPPVPVVGDPEDCSTSPVVCTSDDLPLVNPAPVEPPGLGGCPAGMTAVEAFCVDRWEASLVLDAGGDAPAAPWSPYHHPGLEDPVRAVSAPGLVPQGYISQPVAAAACAAAGKRLCTDGEWLRACRGPAQTVWPFGDAAPGTCNDARTCHPAIQYFETTADWIWSELGHPCLNQLPAGLAPTGAHPGCISAEGALDMAGNLHEWTSDPAGTFRGGFYVDTALNGPGCLYVTTAHSVYHWDYSTGFRCCADL